MKATDPIKNNDRVMAVSKTGQSKEYLFGQLKQDFQNHKLPFEVAKVYHKRTKTYFYIRVRATQGLTFTKLA